MFGNLLTTLMLTCAMGMPSIKPVEKQVNEENNITYRTDNYSEWTNTLSGAYTLNESINYDSLNRANVNTDYIELTFESPSVNDELISFASAYFNANNDYIYVGGINYLYLYISVHNNSYGFTIAFYDDYNDSYDSFTNDDSYLLDYSINHIVGVVGAYYDDTFLENGDIYFNKSITLTDSQKAVFFAFYHRVNFVSENNNTFTGMYVLKDTNIDFNNISLGVYNATYNDYIDWQSLGTSFIFTYQTFPNEFVDCKLSYYGNDSASFDINNVDYLFTWSKTCSFSFYTNSGNFMYTFDLCNSDNDMSYSFATINNVVSKKVCLYISDSIYLTGFWRDVINTFFTKAPNRYWTAYTGWYTFNQYLSNYNGGVLGSIMVNNTLYNTISWTNNNVEVGLVTLATYKLNNNYLYDDVYSNGNWSLESRRVYLSGVLMPIEIYNQMLGNGTFAFVPSAAQSDLKSLIFAIVDAPIKMLTDLMDVELLGTNFFVAFMGIVSVVLICFIVRKII